MTNGKNAVSPADQNLTASARDVSASNGRRTEKYGVKVSHNAIAKWEAEKMPGSTRLPSKEVISALCKCFNVKPSFLIEEMFGKGTSKDSDRLQKFTDIELLTSEEFDALLRVKDLFIKRKNIAGEG